MKLEIGKLYEWNGNTVAENSLLFTIRGKLKKINLKDFLLFLEKIEIKGENFSAHSLRYKFLDKDGEECVLSEKDCECLKRID